jgi:RNA polymerase-interacting CarD/CdnL/TRCF family regulator
MRLDYITNMVISSNNNKKNVENSKIKKENKDAVDSTNNKKNVENSKIKKENKDAVDSTKKGDISLSSSILTELNNKEKEQLSYYEKQVLKELKGIRKTSKNILKSIKKVSN